MIEALIGIFVVCLLPLVFSKISFKKRVMITAVSFLVLAGTFIIAIYITGDKPI
ncbi:MAG: hypothetical protein IMF03_10665 [Proteobacteria bacterium]|nr:hypothetical protein [Pseudomonadota bacterium]